MYLGARRGSGMTRSGSSPDEQWAIAEVRHLEWDLWFRSVLVIAAAVEVTGALVIHAPPGAYPFILGSVALILVYLRSPPGILAARVGRSDVRPRAWPASIRPATEAQQEGPRPAHRYARAVSHNSGPDLHALRAVLLELAGYDSLRVTISLQHDGRTHELRGSPVQLLSRIEEYVEGVEVVRFEF